MSLRYPAVLDEASTLQRVCEGASIARYGDGEFKICRGASIKSQAFDPRLSQRLREILWSPRRGLLVGIPNILSPTPKADFWRGYTGYADLLTDRPYASSFITRPDSAPWIDTPAYWSALASLWVGQHVTLVRGSTKSLIADDLVGAKSVTEIVCPRQHAWSEYDRLLARVCSVSRARVLLCCGPTATVLAADLEAVRLHAIDLGHVGLFWHKRQRGELLGLTKEDKA